MYTHMGSGGMERRIENGTLAAKPMDSLTQFQTVTFMGGLNKILFSFLGCPCRKDCVFCASSVKHMEKEAVVPGTQHCQN
jgi:hypothetical protein